MSRIIRLTLAVILLLGCCTGCWGARNIITLDYVSAMGIDEQEDVFTVYFQLLSFAKIAKQEASSTSNPSPAYIAKGSGRSIEEAIAVISNSSPKPLFFDHMTSLVVSERFLMGGHFPEFMEEINRSQVIRYTIWLYVTRHPIMDIFKVAPTFESSRLYEVLHSPMNVFGENTEIKPTVLHQFTADYYDPGTRAYIPRIAITNKIWHTNDKPRESLGLEGVYVSQNGNLAYIGTDELKGYRWLSNELKRNRLFIYEQENPKQLAVSLIVTDRKFHVEDAWEDGKPALKIKVHLHASINKKYSDASVGELQHQAEQHVEDEIRTTYEVAARHDIDLLEVYEPLFRKDAKAWRQVMLQEGKFVIPDDALKEVQVSLSIDNAGKYVYENMRDSPES